MPHDTFDDSRQQRGDILAVSSRQLVKPAINAERAASGLPSPRVLLGVVVGLGTLLGWGVHTHSTRESRAAGVRQETLASIPTVQTVQTMLQTAPIDLTLPGRTEAFESASIYPRATGYISERRVDIGSRVKKGDLLAHIAAPDLDQQLAQAVAQLGQVQAALKQAEAQVSQAEANLNLARVTLGRAVDLVTKGFQTAQNKDTLQANEITQAANLSAAQAGVAVARANIEAQQATVARLRALDAFEDVAAPFDGVITARNVDRGDLVNADSTSSSPMFTVKREDILRVVVQVPQDVAAGVHDGLKAVVDLPQLGTKPVKGRVVRTSVALLSSARTLTAEVDIPNDAGLIRSGMFTSVTLEVPRVRPDVSVPSEALIFDTAGMMVATVDAESRIKMVPVTIFRDFGTSVDVSHGLKGGERIVLNPPAQLYPQMKVNPEEQISRVDVRGR